MLIVFMMSVMFQSLIGRLKTKVETTTIGNHTMFQSLIGRLKTRETEIAIGRQLDVSIPYR